jgi:hypothetical protein
MPAHINEAFCQRCRYYSGGDFQTLLIKIIEARSFYASPAQVGNRGYPGKISIFASNFIIEI